MPPHRRLVKFEWEVLEERAFVGFGPPSTLPISLGQLCFNFHLQNVPLPHPLFTCLGGAIQPAQVAWRTQLHHRAVAQNECVGARQFSHRSQMETVCTPGKATQAN